MLGVAVNLILFWQERDLKSSVRLTLRQAQGGDAHAEVSACAIALAFRLSKESLSP